jgi:hypothetical protein
MKVIVDGSSAHLDITLRIPLDGQKLGVADVPGMMAAPTDPTISVACDPDMDYTFRVTVVAPGGTGRIWGRYYLSVTEPTETSLNPFDATGTELFGGDTGVAYTAAAPIITNLAVGPNAPDAGIKVYLWYLPTKQNFVKLASAFYPPCPSSSSSSSSSSDSSSSSSDSSSSSSDSSSSSSESSSSMMAKSAKSKSSKIIH